MSTDPMISRQNLGVIIMLRGQYRLLKDKNFRRFTLSCMLAMFGNGLTYIMMMWVLMHFSASVASTSLLMTCFWLPNVIMGPLFGVLTDRWNRKRMLVFANGMRAIVLLAFAVLINQHMSASSIYILASMIGVLLSCYVPVAMSFVRELISTDDLLYGNAMVDIAYEFGGMLGMGAAGFLLAVTTYAGCFAINGICYVFATLLILRISYSPKKIISKEYESLLTQFVKGWQYMRANKPLLLIYLTQGLFFVCYMTAPVLLAPYAKKVLHTSVSQFGSLEGVLSVGVILGGILNPWLAAKFSLIRVVMATMMVGIVGFYLFSHTHNISLAIFYHFMIGISFSSWALLATLAQEMTDLDYQGRVQSLFNSLSGIAIILFYYVLAQWKNIALSKLYSGEIILLAFSIILLLGMLTIRQDADYPDSR